MIERIELENWKTHGSSSLSFKPGTNILVGPMGAGKSSVLDAISFALFGTFPSIQHRRVNVSEIIRSRPEQKESASVSLHFDVNGEKYSVKRSINRSGVTKATFEKNGSYVQSQPQRVNEEIEKVLKVDYDLFSKAIYSEQNSLDYFLNLTPTARKKQVDALLGLDRFATAQDNATSVMNKLKDMAEEAEKNAKGLDIDGLKTQLEKLSQELEKSEHDALLARKELEELESKKKSQEKELNALKEQNEKRVKLEQDIASYKSKMDVLAREIEKIDTMKIGDEKELVALKGKLDKELEASRKEAKEALETERKFQTVLSNVNAELSKSKKDRTEFEKLVDEQKKLDKAAIERRIAELKSSVDECQKLVATHIALKNENAKWIEALQEHLLKCPVCERELEEQMKDKLLAGKKKAVKEFDEIVKEMSARLDKEKKELENETLSMNKLIILEGRIKTYGNIESTVPKLERDLEKAQEEVKKAKKASDDANEILTKKNEELTAIIQKSDAATRRAGYQKQKNDAVESTEKKRAELSSISVDQKQIDSVQDKFTATVAKHSEVSAKLESQKRFSADKKLQITDKEENISKVNSLFEDVKKKREVAENLNRFRISLQETQTTLRSQLIESINGIMHDVWPDLYPYGDYTSVMLEATSDDYILRVKVNTGGENAWHDVEAIASGGERSIACLAMRIAFSLVLAPNLRWLILDEPTHNIDQQGLERFIKMFNEVLPKLIEQTFIITHDPMLKQGNNSKVYLLTRNKDENKETVIEEL